MQQRKIEVCFTPALIPLYNLENAIVVAIDIFRATSSICYGIANGAEAIIPVSTIEECRAYEKEGYLLAAERDGKVVEGFDFGNSPFAYTKEKVSGKTIVLTTTNGTKAMHMAQERAHQVVVGSFLNLTSLCDWLKVQDKDVLLLCAGWKDKFNLEDTLFAGAVVNVLRKDFVHFDDACVAAEDMYLLAKDDLRGYLKKSSHAHILTLSPPINLAPKWLGPHVAYTLSKYDMSMLTLGWAEEFKEDQIACNSLWPRTTIDTAAVRNLLGGVMLANMSRTPAIIADAALFILSKEKLQYTGKTFIDEDVLAAEGITDLAHYSVVPGAKLFYDLFL